MPYWTASISEAVPPINWKETGKAYLTMLCFIIVGACTWTFLSSLDLPGWIILILGTALLGPSLFLAALAAWIYFCD